MNCNTTHYRANSSSVPGDPTRLAAPPTDPNGVATIDFPNASEIKDVLEQVRPWYGRDLVMDRDVAGKLQILAPGQLSRGDAYKVLVAALDILGLTTEPDGNAVKVLPYRELDRMNHH